MLPKYLLSNLIIISLVVRLLEILQIITKRSHIFKERLFYETLCYNRFLLKVYIHKLGARGFTTMNRCNLLYNIKS